MYSFIAITEYVELKNLKQTLKLQLLQDTNSYKIDSQEVFEWTLYPKKIQNPKP